MSTRSGILDARHLSGRVLSSARMFFLRSIFSYVAPALLAAAGLSVLAADRLRAQEASADEAIDFNIPAQALDSALAQYFQATGVQLLYDSGLTAGRRSTTVRGRMAPRAALRLLLSATGLVVRYSNANAAIITKPEEPGSTALVPLGRVFVRERIGSIRMTPVERMAYYQQIEGELRECLRSDHRTARLAFDLIVELRISDEGTLSDIVVARGSGDRRVDRAISDVLQSARVSPPSPLLDQPLRLALKGTRN